jgi:purine nucleoside permease
VATAFGAREAADGSGELGRWLDGYGEFERELAVSGLDAPLYLTDHGVGVTATGIGPARAATSTAALLAGDAVDTSDAYVLTAGVCGIAPAAGTVGSVVLADHVVNWDAKRRRDGTPGVRDWGFGPAQAYELSPPLVDAAVGIAADVDLADSARARAYRSRYDGPAAAPPRVTTGTTAAGGDFWFGHELATQVESLVAGREAGTYATTECEGFGTAVACDRLDALDRYLSVRAAINFDRPPEGPTASDDDVAHHRWRMGAPAYRNAYRVGRAIADAIADNWTDWRDGPPVA